MCASCARCCRRHFRRTRSISRRPTSSRRSSISDCRRRSTCAPSATTRPTICASRRSLRQRIAAIPGIVDAHLQQEVDAPAFYADIDRTRAAQLGLNANTIATNVNVSLSSSEQVTPNFWTDPKSGIPYYLAVQTPENRISSLERSRQHAGFHLAIVDRRRMCRCPGCSATSRRSSAAAFRPTPTRPTSSRSTRSMPACRAAISAASPARSARSWRTCRSSSSPETRSR